ncbi:MAG: LPS export ABC transporter permease LptF [Pseudomonadota bacterium]|jgi:lipopolysaccharide export system permease protein
MRLIETYLFRQLLGPTLAATAALGAVAILSQTLTFLDILVDQRQGLMVFLKVVLLTLPQMLAMVLPLGLFVAALMTLNRLHTEQEIVVCYAGGLSRWNVTAPAFRLGVLAALVTLVVNLWVQPLAMRSLRDELFRVKTDLAASLIREGEFNSPSKGLTVYAQSVDHEGLLKNVFIDEEKPNGDSATFIADRGLVTTRDDKPVLLLRKGSNQQYSAKNVLNYLAFEEYVFDLSPYADRGEVLNYKISDKYLHELLYPDPHNENDWRNRKKYQAEAHYRLSSPIYNISFVALALYGVIGGAFSRVGYGRRIAFVGAGAAVTRIVGFAVQAACGNAPALNLLQYLIPIIPIVYVALRLYRRPQTGLVALVPLTDNYKALGA